MTHVRVWQFRPATGREREFAAAYAAHGVWARLFEQSDAFIGTRLLAPEEPGGPWLTLDEWQSRTAFEQFQDAHGDAYKRLDDELSALTADEQFIGAFDD